MLNASVSSGFSLYYWRDRNDEVDYILEKGGELIAIEIKRNGNDNIRGINTFRKKYPAAKIILIGKRGLPWQEFLNINPIELF